LQNALQRNEAAAAAFQDTIHDTNSPVSCMTSTATAAKPRRRALLTDTAIKNAKPDPQKNVRLSDVGGLFLLVKPNGAWPWRVQLYLRRRQITVALGQYPAVSRWRRHVSASADTRFSAWKACSSFLTSSMLDLLIGLNCWPPGELCPSIYRWVTTRPASHHDSKKSAPTGRP
jgi:hypothetical protein